MKLPDLPEGYRWRQSNVRGGYSGSDYTIRLELWRKTWWILSERVAVRIIGYMGPQTFDTLEAWAERMVKEIDR